MGKNLMVCGNANKALKLNESESTGQRYILEGLFAGPFGVENRNRRIYQADEYLKHLQYLRDDIKRGEPLLGELDHPDDRFEVKMKEVSHRILDLWYDKASNTVQGKLELLNTPNGKLAQSLVDQGIPLHISSRAAGNVNPADKSVTIQQIYTFDLVCKPGFANAVLHRVNESESTDKYTDDVRNFLTESEKSESINTALQFGMMNEDVSIIEVSSDVNLRPEAKAITNVSEADDEEKTTDETEDTENNDNDKDEKDGIEIISVRAETSSSDDEGVEIEGVKADDESDNDEETENADEKEESDKETDESEATDECDKADKDIEKEDEDTTDEKKALDTDDKEKEMLFDCKELTKRKDDFEDKFAELVDAIKNKSEKKKANESHTINKYPISSLLNNANFAEFMGLDESQKTNVITYLQNNKICDIESVNENWKNGIDYNVDEEVWLKYAPQNYRELYESANESVKESIKNTASFVLFENQQDINNFWENTGIAYTESRSILNENFINTMPHIVAEPEKNELSYGKDFIDVVTEMANSYNKM